MKSHPLGFWKLFNVRQWRVRGITPAMILALTVAAFPTAFAIAGGRQVAEQQAKTLIEMITGVTLDITRHGNWVSVVDGEMIYKGSSTGASGWLQEWTDSGQFIATNLFRNPGLQIRPDNNQVSFNFTRITANGRSTDYTGSLTGNISGAPEAALFQIDRGEGLEISIVTFMDEAVAPGSKVVRVNNQVSTIESSLQIVPISVTQGGKSPTIVFSVVAAVAVIAVVVIFVAVTCLIFGWWGCLITPREVFPSHLMPNPWLKEVVFS